MTTLADLIATAQEAGIFQFYLPFVLSYAIIYGILAKIKIFGEEQTGKNINLIVSGILSLFLIGFTPVGITLAEYFGALFTGTVLTIVTILGTMMILYVLASLIGIKIPAKDQPKEWLFLLLLVAIVLAAGVFIASGGTAFFPGFALPGVTIPDLPIPVIPSIGLNSAHIGLLVLLAGTALIIWWMQREGKPASSGASK